MTDDPELILLSRYTRLLPEECESALLAAGGDFWQALYALSTPDEPRESLTAGLDPREPEATARKLLLLRQYLRCDVCQEAWMRIENEDLQASHPGDLEEPLREIEMTRILDLLGQINGGNLVQTALEMLYYCGGELPDRAVAELGRWAAHYDTETAATALRLYARFPKAVPTAQALFLKILNDPRDARRYDAAWALWTLWQNGHPFPEFNSAYRKMLENGTDAEKAFAEDLLNGTSP